MIGQYCFYGNTSSIQEAKTRFKGHIDNSKPIPADLRGVVFSTVMRNGDTTVFEHLVKVRDCCHGDYCCHGDVAP